MIVEIALPALALALTLLSVTPALMRPVPVRAMQAARSR